MEISLARLVIIVLLSSRGSPYYLPGFAPTEYEQGARIEMRARKMKSSETQVDKRYYELNFCRPNSSAEPEGNLGEALTGDYLEPSDYQARITVMIT